MLRSPCITTHRHTHTHTVCNMAEQWASLSSRHCSLSRYYRPQLHEPSNASRHFHNNKRDNTSPVAITIENNMSHFPGQRNWIKEVPDFRQNTLVCACGRGGGCHFSLGHLVSCSGELFSSAEWTLMCRFLNLRFTQNVYLFRLF